MPKKIPFPSPSPFPTYQETCKRVPKDLWGEKLWGMEGPPSVYPVIARYKELGADAWDNARVFRLCRLWRGTFRETVTLLGVIHSTEALKYLRRDRWPTACGIIGTFLEDLYNHTNGKPTRGLIIPLHEWLAQKETCPWCGSKKEKL